MSVPGYMLVPLKPDADTMSVLTSYTSVRNSRQVTSTMSCMSCV